MHFIANCEVRLIRDQATKTVDLYLQRIQKHGSTMAESALPPPNGVNSAKDAPARIGNSNDTSWAGWAISSFTNKAAAAQGEIQPTANGNQPEAAGNALRPSSVPLPSRPSPSTSKIPTETLQPDTLSSTSGRPSSEQPSITAEAEADDVLEAWGTMDDDDDTFFDATANAGSKDSNGGFNTAPATTTPSPAIPFDDGGEPDFAGWLEAQSKAKMKPKKPLPKGLGKSSPTPRDAPRAKSNLRSTTTGSLATSKAKTPAPAKTIDTKPKDESLDDDGWDAWE